MYTSKVTLVSGYRTGEVNGPEFLLYPQMTETHRGPGGAQPQRTNGSKLHEQKDPAASWHHSATWSDVASPGMSDMLDKKAPLPIRKR